MSFYLKKGEKNLFSGPSAAGNGGSLEGPRFLEPFSFSCSAHVTHACTSTGLEFEKLLNFERRELGIATALETAGKITQC